MGKQILTQVVDFRDFKDELDLINQEKRKSLRKLTSNDLDDAYNLIVKNKHRYIGIE